MGNNPNPVAPVRGVDGASWKYKRPDFKTFGFQVSKHTFEAQREVSSNVLTKKPAGPALCKKPTHFWPEPTVIFRASALPGIAGGLARVAGGNNVNLGRVVDIVDVQVLVGVGEMLATNRVAERVYLAGPGGVDAGALRGQGEATNAVAKGSVRKGSRTHAAARW
ncbi:hypothetical protein Q5H92_20090 [Hymenobacter sp. M29]|uniref:Uncharacterized protein n=1 Tax=Hymenobacter mellowenesis TaxID=3063995 RepID=A0ABT9AJ16_9BACT|nr:hypothetical protein [Hymenobacter sp. M29]MDO7848677.1 hypothetical protein [Hymenobacter sp. M29]